MSEIVFLRIILLKIVVESRRKKIKILLIQSLNISKYYSHRTIGLVFRRLPEATPAHSALRLAVDIRAGYRPENRPEWKRRRGRPCRAWMQQTEEDSGLNVNDAWRIAHDRKSWRALRPVAGQAVQ